MTLASWGPSGDHQAAVVAEAHKEGQDTAALLRFTTHHLHQHQQAVGAQGE